MAYGAAIVAAIAAVGSLAVTAVSSADTARRAQHAAEDQADYNTKVLVPMENARRDAMLEQSRRQRAQSIAALRVNAGKATGGKISDDTTAAWLIEDTMTEFEKDAKAIEETTRFNIANINFGTSQGYDRASAINAQQTANMAFSAVNTVGNVGKSGLLK
jgi:hypothetical protein